VCERETHYGVIVVVAEYYSTHLIAHSQQLAEAYDSIIGVNAVLAHSEREQVVWYRGMVRYGMVGHFRVPYGIVGYGRVL